MTRKQKILEFADQGYRISVCGRHVHVTEAMKAYAEEKVSKLERFGDRIIEVNIIMDIQKIEHRCDIVMKYGHTLIKSHAITPDMYQSIDKAMEKLEAQLKKYLNKIHEHHAKGHPVVDVPVKIYASEIFEEAEELKMINEEIEREVKNSRLAQLVPHHIVKHESKPLKILTDHEAIMEMELSLAKVLVFRGEEDRKLKVIYRLDNGDYGIIEPEANV